MFWTMEYFPSLYILDILLSTFSPTPFPFMFHQWFLNFLFPFYLTNLQNNYWSFFPVNRAKWSTKRRSPKASRTCLRLSSDCSEEKTSERLLLLYKKVNCLNRRDCWCSVKADIEKLPDIVKRNEHNIRESVIRA